MIQIGIPGFLILSWFIGFTAIAQTKGTMIIEVTGLRNNKGTVRIGVYNKENDFLEDAGVIKKLSCTVQENKCLIDSGQLPYGDYSFALLHDENNNGAMDYNFIKIPKEGFGFSNNPTIRMSAPSFEDTKIRLNTSEQKITIKAKYM